MHSPPRLFIPIYTQSPKTAYSPQSSAYQSGSPWSTPRMLNGREAVQLRCVFLPVSGFSSVTLTVCVQKPADAISESSGEALSRFMTSMPKCFSPESSFCCEPSAEALQSENVPLTRPVALANFTCTLQGLTLEARSYSEPAAASDLFFVEKALPERSTAVPPGWASRE